MKIKVHGVPEYTLSVDYATVAILSKLAGLHYDLTCKASARVGGFLYGWQNALSPPAPSESVRGSWRNLDLTLKICEMARYAGLSEEDMVRVGAYVVAVQNALAATPEIAKGWVSDV